MLFKSYLVFRVSESGLVRSPKYPQSSHQLYYSGYATRPDAFSSIEHFGETGESYVVVDTWFNAGPLGTDSA